MTRLRRSVLWLTPSLAAGWSSAEPEAIPDAVIIDGQRALDQSLLDELRAQGVDSIVDDTCGANADPARHGPSSIWVQPSRLARPQGASRLQERLRGRDIEFLVQSAPDVLALRRAIQVAPGPVVSVIVDPDAVARDLRSGDSSAVDPLTFVREEVLIAAMLAGALPVGCFTPRGRYRYIGSNHGAGSIAARYSFLTGFRGALCRTWTETAAANRGYLPDAAAVSQARELMNQVAHAVVGGLGPIGADGVLVGLALMRAAESILMMAEGVARRDQLGGRLAVERA